MREREFFQDGPQLENTWKHDAFLRSCLRRLLPENVYREIEPGFAQLGERAAFEMPAYAADAERNPPEHIPYDPWGRRVDEIRVADGWRKLHRVAAEEGIVATAYEREHGEYSRLHQFARLYLYHPSSAICSCPLAMTDGAARLLELHASDDLSRQRFTRLVSRDPEFFWTSGQWMTERAGGSDVSRSETVARREHGEWRLYGTKWFTSATTSPMACTLARIEEHGRLDDALSVFCLELRDAHGGLDGIQVNRLKDKLGTRALPTAELSLRGVPATLVGERGKGVRTIATLLNITRLYNACCAASQMRRAVMLASDYAERRVAFGKPLIEHALHADTLAALDAETRGATLMVLHAAALLGREETGVADENERQRLRLLTPLIKLYTAKQAIAVCSEALEAFGGAGYVEDTGLPWLLRDAQVLSIWEGTTNVLSLDVLRAAARDDSLPAWISDMQARIGQVRHPDLQSARSDIDTRLTALAGLLAGERERNARRIAFVAARVLGAVLLAEQAEWEANQGERGTFEALQQWLRGELLPEPA